MAKTVGLFPDSKQSRLFFEFSFRKDADGDRGEDTGGEEVEAPPGDLDPADADAFGQRDVECDQEDVGHRQFAQNMQHRQDFGRQKVEMQQAQTDGFEIGREEGKEGDQEGEENVRTPETLEAGYHADFIEGK